MRKGNKGEGKVHRRSIMLPPAFVAEMERIREATGAQSDSEVIRRAFTLYTKLVSSDVQTIEITTRDGGKKEVIIT